jgi:DNA-binding beta-propeller fold protein YncE
MAPFPSGVTAIPASIAGRPQFYANSLAFSRNGQSLYVDGNEVSTATGLPTGRSIRGDFDAPNAVAFDAGGRKAVVAEADTTLRLFDTRSGKELRTVGFTVEPLVADIDPQTGNVIAGLADGTIVRFDAELNMLQKYTGVSGMMPVQIMSGGTHLIAALAPQAGGAPPSPQLLDYATGKWTIVPSATGAVAAQRKGKSMIVYKLRGRGLLAEELQPSAK